MQGTKKKWQDETDFSYSDHGPFQFLLHNQNQNGRRKEMQGEVWKSTYETRTFFWKLLNMDNAILIGVIWLAIIVVICIAHKVFKHKANGQAKIIRMDNYTGNFNDAV